MTKRRWLKAAIEEAGKPQVALPWARERARADAAAILRRTARPAAGAHA